MVCVCALPSASVCLQLIKDCASIDYSHVVKRPLFSYPLIKDAARWKSWFIVILMLVWACRKKWKEKKKEAVSQWETSSSSTLHRIHSTHTYNLCPTQTHTLAAFSQPFLAALCVSVGMLDGKSVTMHLYSRPGWEIIKFNNSLDSALFGALLLHFYTLFPGCLALSLSLPLVVANLATAKWTDASYTICFKVWIIQKVSVTHEDHLTHTLDHNLLGYRPIKHFTKQEFVALCVLIIEQRN